MPFHLRVCLCNHGEVSPFEDELTRVLPLDLPHRPRLVELAARHLEAIRDANEYMNLTRITSPQEAAAKHVYDCVAPWRCFQSANKVLDAGTGAGFPGVPLSVVLPGVRFVFSESTGKKARFVAEATEELGLTNVEVLNERAEAIAQTRHFDVITARAVAPLPKLLDLFGRFLRNGTRLLLYKGPDVENELQEAKDYDFAAEILQQYELPDGLGSRTLLEVRAQGR